MERQVDFFSISSVDIATQRSLAEQQKDDSFDSGAELNRNDSFNSLEQTRASQESVGTFFGSAWEAWWSVFATVDLNIMRSRIFCKCLSDDPCISDIETGLFFRFAVPAGFLLNHTKYDQPSHESRSDGGSRSERRQSAGYRCNQLDSEICDCLTRLWERNFSSYGQSLDWR